jgi:ribosome-associated protein
MGEVVRITDDVTVPVEELEFRVSRSSGPGGQGVNTTDSRVELRFDLTGSPSLSEAQRQRALRRLGRRVDPGGTLRVVAQTHRSQLANRRAAMERFADLLAEAVAPPPKPRRPTRPGVAARARRLDAKRHRATVKRQRRRPPPGDG